MKTKKRKRLSAINSGENDPQLDISSLIDVCFLLLIYFIVTSTIAQPESDLILKLPQNGKGSEIDHLSYQITKDGVIFHLADAEDKRPMTSPGNSTLKHRKPSDMPKLERQIRAYSQMLGNNAMVCINVEDETPSQYVVDFINLLSAKEVQNIVFTN